MKNHWMKLNTLKNKFLREAIEVEARWAITLQSIKETTILLESQHQQQIHNTVKSIVCNARVFQFGDQMKDSLWTPKLTLIQQYTSQANTCLRLALIARSEIID